MLPVIRNDTGFARSTKLLDPLNDNALPNRPNDDHVAPLIVPLFPRPDESTNVPPAPSSNPYAATGAGPEAAWKVAT
jgi:hypothetical protein